MIVYRIEREKYLKTTLQSLGAALSSGFRWNSMNTRLVYTSQSRALATLEVSVHLDLSEDLPNDRHYVEINIPDSLPIMEVQIDDLPFNWNFKPPTKTTQIIGDDFVLYNQAAVLKVPSSIVAEEYNFLLNPFHPDFKKIKVVQTQNMQFDSRIKPSK